MDGNFLLLFFSGYRYVLFVGCTRKFLFISMINEPFLVNLLIGTHLA